MYDRAIQYKHELEINTYRVLNEQLHHHISGLVDLSIIKQSLSKNISHETQPAIIFAILDEQRNVVFNYVKNNVEENVFRDSLSNINKINAKYEGSIKKNNASYFWIIKELSGYSKKSYSLLIIFPLSSPILSEVYKFFGLPFIVSGFLLCWLMVWASIILSSLVTKLQGQKKVLSKQAEDIEKARDEALVASQAKTDFLANMSHEIRTPLTSIIGFAETCLEVDQSMKERSKATKTIIKSGKHLMHIINEILDLTKIEAGKLEVEFYSFSIMAVLEEVKQLVSVMANEKGISFTVNYHFPLPKKITSDQLRLKQILLNLCSNAIKFTTAGHVYLNVTYSGDSSCLIFDVEDTGVGLSEEQMEKIFKPFEQADSSTTRKFGGTGLGLTLSKQFIEMLNGELSVESKLNVGSRFTAKIRLAEKEIKEFVYEVDHSENIEKKTTLYNETVLLNGKVLIAEDNEDIQDLVMLLLKKVGIAPDIVDNGKKALELVGASKYDLVFLDLQMPVMDGLTVMKELKKQGYEEPVVAMTANAMKKDREECKEYGFSDFVSKPIDRNDLYSILNQYLEPAKKQESNSKLLTSNLLHDEPELIDLINKFMKRLPVMQDAINQAHSEGKEEELSGLIHQMKGVGGGYGYPMLTELCARMEFQLENQDSKNVSTLIGEFNLMVKKILEGRDENHKIAEQAESK